MNTTTPTEAHRQLALRLDAMLWHGTPQTSAETEAAAQLIADSEARATAELRGALALGQENCDAAFDELRADCDELRGDVVRLTARAERAEAALAAEREKAERYRLASLKLDAQLADWSVLNAWGGTPEIIHKFVKGQQARIHYCQNIEADLAAEQARLDAGTIMLTVAGERVWHCGVDLRAAIDAGIKEPKR